jgi:hypothetical protein
MLITYVQRAAIPPAMAQREEEGGSLANFGSEEYFLPLVAPAPYLFAATPLIVDDAPLPVLALDEDIPPTFPTMPSVWGMLGAGESGDLGMVVVTASMDDHLQMPWFVWPMTMPGKTPQEEESLSFVYVEEDAAIQLRMVWQPPPIVVAPAPGEDPLTFLYVDEDISSPFPSALIPWLTILLGENGDVGMGVVTASMDDDLGTPVIVWPFVISGGLRQEEESLSFVYVEEDAALPLRLVWPVLPAILAPTRDEDPLLFLYVDEDIPPPFPMTAGRWVSVDIRDVDSVAFGTGGTLLEEQYILSPGGIWLPSVMGQVPVDTSDMPQQLSVDENPGPGFKAWAPWPIVTFTDSTVVGTFANIGIDELFARPTVPWDVVYVWRAPWAETPWIIFVVTHPQTGGFFMFFS